MKFVYQTSINPTRQKEQAIVKQAAQKVGIEPRAEVGVGVGLLLVGRRQPRHVREVLGRHADVHDEA